MASIFKRPNSTIWHCQYYIKTEAGLKQIRKSTGQTSKRKALAAAVEMERAAAGIMPSASSERIKRIFSDIVVAAESGTLTEDQCRNGMREIHELATDEKLTDWTIESWCNEYLKRSKPHVKANTLSNKTRHLREFINAASDRSEKPLHTVTASHIRDFRDDLVDQGLRGQSVNLIIVSIKACLQAAVKDGILNTNPADRVEPLPETKIPKIPFTIEEVGLLLTNCPTPDWRGLIVMAALTGLRLHDAARLTWENIDKQTRILFVTPQKTIKDETTTRIPLTDQMVDAIPNWHDEKLPSQYLFPSLACSTTLSQPEIRS